jgi:uncharacterized protein with ATP-grasp and redox domains
VKAGRDCFACIRRLVDVASEMSTGDTELRERARLEAVAILQNGYNGDVVPAHLSTEILRRLKEITGNRDPFGEVKRKEMEFARNIASLINPRPNLRSLLEFAAMGNTLDFFRGPESLLGMIDGFPGFVQDDVDAFAQSLPAAEKILYLADNAGECFFDIPLVAHLSQNAEVTYVVKDSSAQNDATYADLEHVGIVEKMGKVLTTGDDAIGIDLRTASEEMREELEKSDLIVAKGMGNYETLSEMPFRSKTMYVLMAKCRPVASSLRVPINSYVAIMG